MKKKYTFYIAEDMLQQLENLYAGRILKGNKTSKSALIEEALILLFAKRDR